MRLSAVRSSIVFAVVGFLYLGPPALASSRGVGANLERAASLKIYGAYLPGRLEWEDARWGFGIASRVTLNSRWGIDLGASRFKASNRAITPVTIGATYGPVWNGGIRPWVEFGAGYYREETIHSSIATDFDPYYVPYPSGLRTTTKTAQGMVGGYFGVGVDIPLSDRLTMGTGARMHGWSDYSLDGLVALQSGLSFGF